MPDADGCIRELTGLGRAARATRVVGLSGSTRRASRTTVLVEAVASRLAGKCEIAFDLLDVASIGPGLSAFSRDELTPAGRAALRAMAQADALIIGLPLRKRSCAGLFKHLSGILEPAALDGKPVVLAATGDGRHALAIEHQLRALFASFAALVLPTVVCAGDEEPKDGAFHDPATLARIEGAAAELAAHARPRQRGDIPSILGRAA